MKGYIVLIVFCMLGSSIVNGQNIGLQVDGFVGIGIENPQTELHVAGDLTTPWGLTWYQYQTNFEVHHRFKPWLKRAWSSLTGDYLYLSGVGNRYNHQQTGIMLSERKGFIVGRGSDSATEIGVEYMSIDTSGSMVIEVLKGNSTRRLTVSAEGTLGTHKIQRTINYGIYSFISEYSEVEFQRAFYGIDVMGDNQLYRFGVPITIPVGSTIDSLVYFFTDNCSNSGLTFHIEEELLGSGLVTAPVGTYSTGTEAQPGYNKAMNIAVNITLKPNSAYSVQVRGTNYDSCDMWINGVKLVYTPPD